MKLLQALAMRSKALSTVAVVLVITTTLAENVFAQGALDRVRRRNGVDTGKIEGTSPLGVKIVKGGVEKQVPTEEIVSVYYASEPQELSAARTAADRGKHQESLKLLSEIDEKKIRREEIRAELAFLNVAAKSQLALSGRGKLTDAQSTIKKFFAGNKSSFHTLEAIKLLGDLYLADEDFASARKEYQRIAKAPSPYFKLRSELLVGKAWQAEGDDAQAAKAFQSVVDSSETGASLEPLKLAATLELAVSKAASGDASQSVSTLQGIINEADPENDGELLGQAYNALGSAYLKAGDTQAALFSFLHVDLLYSQSAEQHAQALYELKTLWQEMGRSDRADEAAKELAERYPESRWASR